MKFICKQCKKTFHKFASQKPIFCSRKCNQKAHIGFHHSIETRIKIGKSKIGNKYFLGKKHSLKTRKKWSIKRKGCIPWNKNKKGYMFKHAKHRFADKSGYILIRTANHPHNDRFGYVREHRLVMEKHLGRYLKPEEVVHHKGIKFPIGSIENIQDDRPENLQLFVNNSKHIKFHFSKRCRNAIGQLLPY